MIFKLEAEMRNVGKKQLVKETRTMGRIPAVVYGRGDENIAISLPKTDFMKSYKKSIGEIAIFNIKVAGKEYQTIVKERQIHPVSRDIIHVDFMTMQADKAIHIDVPIKIVGEPAGVKSGAILDVQHRSLQVSCKPAFIPEDIEIDVTNMEIGDAIHIKDIHKENVVMRDAADVVIASLHYPKHSVDTDATVDAAPAE